MHLEKVMAQRNKEWEQKKRDFINARMDELKEKILEHARTEYQKDKNKEIIAQKAKERAERDRAIAEKSKAEDITAEAMGKNLDSNEFKRSEKPAEKASPTKPVDRPPKADDSSFAIKRSDKPRASGEEEKKAGGPTRGPRNEPKQEDTGFARGNFTSKKNEDSGPPKRQNKPAASDSGNAGFGFRSNNAAAAKPAGKK
jgi:hypothetical protein